MADYSRKIWDYFIDPNKIGNAFGVAGLLGNLESESALYPNNLQNSYSAKFNLSDEEYTKAVDNGTYSWVGNYKYKDSNKVEHYYYCDGKSPKISFILDSAGYSLAQWTHWSRKKALYEKWKANTAKYPSIGCIELALDYLWDEIKGNGYNKLLDHLRNAISVREASDYVLDDFEKPLERHYVERANRGQAWYDLYSNTNNLNFVNNTSPSITNFVPRTTDPSLNENDPGRKYYICQEDGGMNLCIRINGHDHMNKGLTALPNCVGYAWGRACEILGYAPMLSTSDAGMWYEYTADTYERSSNVPKLGAVACWSVPGGAGHVAIVEKINYNSNGAVKSVDISWGGYWHSTSCKCTMFKYDANILCKDGVPTAGRGGSGKNYIFQGYIYLPEDFNTSVEVVPDTDSTYSEDDSTPDVIIDSTGSLRPTVKPTVRVSDVVIQSASGKNLETNKFNASIRVEVEPGATLIGYLLSLISNYEILYEKDSPVVNNFTFYPNAFKSGITVKHGENMQLGVRTISEITIENEDGTVSTEIVISKYPVCSNSICLKLKSEMSDILYLNNDNKLRRVQPYLRDCPAKIFKNI